MLTPLLKSLQSDFEAKTVKLFTNPSAHCHQALDGRNKKVMARHRTNGGLKCWNCTYARLQHVIGEGYQLIMFPTQNREHSASCKLFL